MKIIVGPWQRRARRRMRLPLWILVATFVAIGALGGSALGSLPDVTQWMLGASQQVRPTSTAISRTFPICVGGLRTTCVVDGDTFWLDGTKIRIADFNTPETGQPACAAEAAMGRQATLRLQQLLSTGPFELAAADRDEDRYGRKLRIVLRDGRSIGDTLIAEGLAHSWQGRRETWC